MSSETILAMLQEIKSKQDELIHQVSAMSVGLTTTNTDLKTLRSEISQLRELAQITAIAVRQ